MSKAYEFLNGKDIEVHCKTKEEAEEFFEMIKDDGIKWNSGVELNIGNHWNHYKENTCYRIDINKRMLYGDSRRVKEHNDKIIEFTEFKKKVERMKVGDRVEVTQLYAHDRDQGICIGDIGTVVRACDIGCRVKFDKRDGSYLIQDYQLRKVEENKMEFTKKDLRNWMVIEFKNGTRRIICERDSKIYYTGEKCGMIGKSYNDNLEDTYNDGFSIQKVIIPDFGSIENMLNTTNKPIWERKEPKEMTVADIEKELGYPVKIVKE